MTDAEELCSRDYISAAGTSRRKRVKDGDKIYFGVAEKNVGVADSHMKTF